MENDTIFVKSLLTDKVKIQPKLLNKNVDALILATLKSKFEGKCTHHGYIRPNSISIVKCSMGHVIAVSLNGDVSYNVQFTAAVCNPSIDAIIAAKVLNTNKFGILAEYGITLQNGETVPVLEIIVAKNALDANSSVDFESIKIGDTINVMVLGKKYELNDQKISVIGKIITSTDIKFENKVDFETDDDDNESNDEDDNTSVVNNENSEDDEEDDDEEEEEEEVDNEDQESDNEDNNFGSDHDEDEDYFSDGDKSSVQSSEASEP